MNSFEYIPQGYKFNGTLHNLPLSLNKLMVTSAPFNQPLKLPPKLHILKIASETYNNELNLPTQLQVLEFRSDVFNKEMHFQSQFIVSDIAPDFSIPSAFSYIDLMQEFLKI